MKPEIILFVIVISLIWITLIYQLRKPDKESLEFYSTITRRITFEHSLDVKINKIDVLNFVYQKINDTLFLSPLYDFDKNIFIDDEIGYASRLYKKQNNDTLVVFRKHNLGVMYFRVYKEDKDKEKPISWWLQIFFE